MASQTGPGRGTLSPDSRLVLAAQAARAFGYGFGAVLLGITLESRRLSPAEVGGVLVGFLRRGWAGALAVAAVFITPSFLAVLAVAVIYVRYSGLPVVQSLFYGIAPAVMAIIAVAAYKLGRLTNRRDIRLWAISAAVGLVTAITGTEVAVLFVAAGLLMIAIDAPSRGLTRVFRHGSAGLLLGYPKFVMPRRPGH